MKLPLFLLTIAITRVVTAGVVLDEQYLATTGTHSFIYTAPETAKFVVVQVTRQFADGFKSHDSVLFIADRMRTFPLKFGPLRFLEKKQLFVEAFGRVITWNKGRCDYRIEEGTNDVIVFEISNELDEERVEAEREKRAHKFVYEFVVHSTSEVDQLLRESPLPRRDPVARVNELSRVGMIYLSWGRNERLGLPVAGSLLATSDWRGEFKQARVLSVSSVTGQPVFIVHAAPVQGRQRWSIWTPNMD
jgi:hypothetical protein